MLPHVGALGQRHTQSLESAKWEKIATEPTVTDRQAQPQERPRFDLFICNKIILEPGINFGPMWELGSSPASPSSSSRALFADALSQPSLQLARPRTHLRTDARTELGSTSDKTKFFYEFMVSVETALRVHLHFYAVCVWHVRAPPAAPSTLARGPGYYSYLQVLHRTQLYRVPTRPGTSPGPIHPPPR